MNQKSQVDARPPSAFLAMAEHFATNCARIDPREIFREGSREQTRVWNLAKMLGDEPNWFVASHPVQMIKAAEIHRS